jgi:hypothetical protein
MGMTRQIKRHLNNQHLFHNAPGTVVFVLSILNASRPGANNIIKINKKGKLRKGMSNISMSQWQYNKHH